MRFLKQDVRFLGSLALHLHEEAVVDILANYTVLIDVGTVLNVFQVPVVEIGEVKIGVDHGEAECLIPEEVVDLLLRPTCLFCRCIYTFLKPYLQIFEGFAVIVAL